VESRARLDAAQRERFFRAFVAAVRLDQLALRAWLLKRLKSGPLAAPIDPARFTISDADMALLLKKLVGELRHHRQRTASAHAQHHDDGGID
jgi:hypothetical protein